MGLVEASSVPCPEAQHGLGFARRGAHILRWRVPHGCVVFDRDRVAVDIMAADNIDGHR